MIFFLLFFVFSVKSSLTLQSEEKLEGTPFTESSYRKFQKKLAILGDIQGEIFNKGKKPRYSSRDHVPIVEELPDRPEEKPYLFQGDILLSDQQMDIILKDVEGQLSMMKKRHNKRQGESIVTQWALPIPYFITDLSLESIVEEAIEMWQGGTCITFRRLYKAPANRNALIFGRFAGGCWSAIGQQGTNPQNISLGDNCVSVGIAAHQIGHALGLFHEQSRSDRDRYVKVNTKNILPDQMGQFSMETNNIMNDYGVSYDMGSLLHYSSKAFAYPSYGNTLSTNDPNFQYTIGQREQPSFADLMKINQAYCQSVCNSYLACLNGGYTDPKNCTICRCPSGFGGQQCERADDNPAECGLGDLIATEEFQSISERGSIKCHYVIQAPVGKKIVFEIVAFNFTTANLFNKCDSSFLEIKYGLDMTPTGARLCKEFPMRMMTQGDKLVVIYRGDDYTRFAIRFRYDPINETTTTITTTISSVTTSRPIPYTPRVWTFYPFSSATPKGWTFFPQPAADSVRRTGTFFPRFVTPSSV